MQLFAHLLFSLITVTSFLPACFTAPTKPARRSPDVVSYAKGGLTINPSNNPFIQLNTDAAWYFQGDGNIVGYLGTPTASDSFASTGTAGHPDCINISNCEFTFQTDGNAVIYVDGKAIWSSGTAGTGNRLYFNYELPLKPGIIVLYMYIENSNNQIIWCLHESFCSNL